MSRIAITNWLVWALLSGCVCIAQTQRVVLEIQLDPQGKIVGAKATSGNPRLFAAAISAATARAYKRDCDDKGNAIKSSLTLYADFDDQGNFSRLEFPIRVGVHPSETKIIKRVEPEYPAELKKAGVSGLVLLEARIDPGGNVVAARAIRGDSRLVPYAVKAVLNWKYRPTYFGCEPVPIVITVAVSFTAR